VSANPPPAIYGHTLRGYVYIAAATLFWAISASLGRAAFTGRLPAVGAVGSVDPLILSQSRVTFALLILFPVLFLRRGWSSLRVPSADTGRMFLLGIVGVAAANYFYYLAIQRTNVATAIIVQYTAPVWILLYLIARGVQKATFRLVTATTLAVAGIALVIGIAGSSGFRADRLGLMAGLLAAFAFAFYNIAGHTIMGRYDHWTVLLYVTLSASFFWILINPPWKIAAHHYTGGQWLFLLAFSSVSMLVPYSFYIAGLRYLDPTRAVVVSCLEPVFSIIVAAYALREVVHLSQAAGIAMVVAAILLVQAADKHSPQPIRVEPIE
jgi:DME family drug/metabolite transporter